VVGRRVPCPPLGRACHSSPFRNSLRNSHAHANAHADTPYGNGNIDSYSDSSAYPNEHSGADGDAHCYRYAVTNAHTDADDHSHPHSYLAAAG